MDIQGHLKREITTNEPFYFYTNQMKQSDFGDGEHDLKIQVAQLNDSGASGSPSTLNVLNI